MKFPDWLTVFGDVEYRGDCPKEGAEQATFFNILRKECPELGAIAIHIKNEGKRTRHQVEIDKMQGMVTGAPDVIIPGAKTVLIEIKRQDHTKSRWQPGQLEYLEAAKAQGAFVCVALGYKSALDAIFFALGVDVGRNKV